MGVMLEYIKYGDLKKYPILDLEVVLLLWDMQNIIAY